MPSVSSRRPPWPGEFMLGGHRLMTVDGSLIAKKTQSLENVAPTQQ
jgi:hypothetical protein